VQSFYHPEFPLSGLEDDDIELWIEKIENVAHIHGLSPAVMISVAANNLIKTARRWFDVNTGNTNKSWTDFKTVIFCRFRRRIPFGVIMQKIEARKWIFSSESFQDYAMDKLALIQRLRLPDYDTIHLLINGISNLSIRAAALALDLNFLDSFLERMHHLTTSCEEPLRKISANPRFFGNLKDIGSKSVKLKDPVLSTENSVQLYRDLHCVYCHGKDYIRIDCPKLKKKDQSSKSSLLQSVVAVSINEENSSQESIHTELTQIVALVVTACMRHY